MAAGDPASLRPVDRPRSPDRLPWLVMAAVGLACAGALAIAGAVRPTTRTVDSLVALRLDRPEVHFHLALVAAASRGGPTSAASRDLLAPDDADAIERLAELGWSRRVEGASLLRTGTHRSIPPLLPSLPLSGPAHLTRQDDLSVRLLVTMSEAAELGIPKQVLVFMALDVAQELGPLEQTREVDIPIASLLHAEIALAYARAGHCGLPSTASDVRASALARWVHAGAQACCALRAQDPRAAVAHVEAALEHLAVLEPGPATEAALRAWISIERGDAQRARAILDDARDGAQTPQEARRIEVLRDALARPEGAGVHGVSERLVDRRWLSQLVLETLALPRARAALRVHFAEGTLEGARSAVLSESRALAVARQRHPFFDHTPH